MIGLISFGEERLGAATMMKFTFLSAFGSSEDVISETNLLFVRARKGC